MKQNDYFEELMKEIHADKEMPTVAYRRELMKKLAEKGSKARRPVMMRVAISCAVVGCCLLLGIGIYYGNMPETFDVQITDSDHRKDAERDGAKDSYHNQEDTEQDNTINRQENNKSKYSEEESERKPTEKEENESDSVPESTPEVPDTTPISPKSTPKVTDSTYILPEKTPEVPDATPIIPEKTPEMPGNTPDAAEGIQIIPADASEPINTTSPLPVSPSEAPVVLADLPDEISLSLCNMTKFDISEEDFGSNEMFVKELGSRYFTDQLITSYSQMENLIQQIMAKIEENDNCYTGLEDVIKSLEKYDASYFETKSLCIGNTWLTWGYCVELGAVGVKEGAEDILEVQIKGIWDVPPDGVALCVMVNHVCIVEIPTVKGMNCNGVEFTTSTEK